MELAVFNIEGKDTGKKVQLNDAVFGVEPNDHAIYLAVKQYMANKRQGTHKSKERAEIAGSTRKLKKQKGTGTARAGSIKSPVFRGGGRVFGPRPRDYSFKLNKKLKQLARKSALTYKAKDNQIVILEDFSIETPKTKQIVALKKNLSVENQKALIVLKEENSTIYLSVRNMPDTKVVVARELNTYNVLDNKRLILTEGAVEVINTLFE